MKSKLQNSCPACYKIVKTVRDENGDRVMISHRDSLHDPCEGSGCAPKETEEHMYNSNSAPFTFRKQQIEGVSRAAVISECETFRYQLDRVWDRHLPNLTYIMLNPSTADAVIDDPTIKRCHGFASDWGYGSFRVVNLFAFRSPAPKKLDHAKDPVGPENDDYIRRAVRNSDALVFAWGALDKSYVLERANEVEKMIRDMKLLKPYCMGRSRNGAPRHPLMLPKDTQRELWAGYKRG